MKRSDYRYLERTQVRWSEVDMQNIVFNGHYLLYMDTAMTGYWRALALPYAETFARLGGELYVRKATLEYEGSARRDDVLDTGVRCLRVGSSSVTFEMGVLRDETPLVRGEIVYVYADPKAMKSLPVPAPLREAIAAFEAGEPMLDVQVGGWDTLSEDALPLRRAVFVDELGFDAGLVTDAGDADAVHAVARNRFGMALASGRLLASAGHDVSRIALMAVWRTLRGTGVGRLVLDRLVDAARTRGDAAVELSALTAAVPFYERAGFRVDGAVFQEAGRAHVPMRRALR